MDTVCAGSIAHDPRLAAGYSPAVMPRAFALVALALTACSTIHGVKPVGEGVVRPDLPFGGPITEVYGAPIPIPITQIGATYGLDDKTDVHAAWHSSAAAFYNLFGADVGASRELVEWAGARPRVMTDLTVLTFAGDNEPGGSSNIPVVPTYYAPGNIDPKVVWHPVGADHDETPDVDPDGYGEHLAGWITGSDWPE